MGQNRSFHWPAGPETVKLRSGFHCEGTQYMQELLPALHHERRRIPHPLDAAESFQIRVQ